MTGRPDKKRIDCSLVPAVPLYPVFFSILLPVECLKVLNRSSFHPVAYQKVLYHLSFHPVAYQKVLYHLSFHPVAYQKVLYHSSFHPVAYQKVLYCLSVHLTVECRRVQHWLPARLIVVWQSRMGLMTKPRCLWTG